MLTITRQGDNISHAHAVLEFHGVEVGADDISNVNIIFGEQPDSQILGVVLSPTTAILLLMDLAQKLGYDITEIEED